MVYFESGVSPFSVTYNLSKQWSHEQSETNDIDNDILFLLVLLARSRPKRET